MTLAQWVRRYWESGTRILALGLVVSMGTARADPITIATDQILRADFDLSGCIPTGPYDYLRFEFWFDDFLQPNEFISMTVFNDSGEAYNSYRNTIVNTFGFPIDNVGFDIPVWPLLPTDASGFVLIQFSQEISVNTLDFAGTIEGDPWALSTNRVAGTLSLFNAVPEPSSLLLLGIGLGALGLATWRRRK